MKSPEQLQLQTFAYATISDESSRMWKEKYEENVAHIKKELQDLRKATYNLRKNLQKNQNRIRRVLVSKKSIGRKESLRTPLKENTNRLNTETEKQWEDEKSTLQKQKEQFNVSKDELIAEPSYFQKFMRQLEKTHDFLFKMIVKDRIKSGTGQSRVQIEKAKHRKAHTRMIRTRRVKSRRSMRNQKY